MIPKDPLDPSRFAVDRRFTRSARAGFQHLLGHLAPSGGRILLPAYIGLSPIEGSGVFDPVTAVGIDCAFYRVGPDLEVDLDDLEARLRERPAAAVLLIHYFGAPEPSLLDVAHLARAHGAALIEDCAHTIGSSTEGLPVGAVGDYAIYSIHKILAVATGGFLRINRSEPAIGPTPDDFSIDPTVEAAFHAADLAAISRARIDRYQRLATAVADIDGVELFWPELPPGAVPHTLPVRIVGHDRFDVYKRMRADDVGVVALYHTLVDAIDLDRFPASRDLSASILNLPIHQGVDTDAIPRIAQSLRDALPG